MTGAITLEVTVLSREARVRKGSAFSRHVPKPADRVRQARSLGRARVHPQLEQRLAAMPEVHTRSREPRGELCPSIEGQQTCY